MCLSCWKSAMSPLAPMIVLSPTGWKRWISLNRARDPYEATAMTVFGKHNNREGWKKHIRTEIISGHHDTIFIFESEDTGACDDRLSAHTRQLLAQNTNEGSKEVHTGSAGLPLRRHRYVAGGHEGGMCRMRRYSRCAMHRPGQNPNLSHSGAQH